MWVTSRKTAVFWSRGALCTVLRELTIRFFSPINPAYSTEAYYLFYLMEMIEYIWTLEIIEESKL